MSRFALVGHDGLALEPRAVDDIDMVVDGEASNFERHYNRQARSGRQVFLTLDNSSCLVQT